MENKRQNGYARSNKQVEEMRRLYSRIGEPLPADIIIDLYQHLDKALRFVGERGSGGGKKPRAQA